MNGLKPRIFVRGLTQLGPDRRYPSRARLRTIPAPPLRSVVETACAPLDKAPTLANRSALWLARTARLYLALKVLRLSGLRKYKMASKGLGWSCRPELVYSLGRLMASEVNGMGEIHITLQVRILVITKQYLLINIYPLLSPRDY